MFVRVYIPLYPLHLYPIGFGENGLISMKEKTRRETEGITSEEMQRIYHSNLGNY